MHGGKTIQTNRENANSGALARLTGELKKLRSSDPGGYDPYNSSVRFRHLEPDTDVVPILDVPQAGAALAVIDPQRGA